MHAPRHAAQFDVPMGGYQYAPRVALIGTTRARFVTHRRRHRLTTAARALLCHRPYFLRRGGIRLAV